MRHFDRIVSRWWDSALDVRGQFGAVSPLVLAALLVLLVWVVRTTARTLSSPR